MQKRDYLKFYSLLLSLTFLCAACAPTPAAATEVPANTITPSNTVTPSPLPPTGTPTSTSSPTPTQNSTLAPPLSSAIITKDTVDDLVVVATLEVENFESLTGLTFSKDMNFLAGGFYGNAYVWEIPSLQEVRKFSGQWEAYQVFSPSAHQIFVAKAGKFGPVWGTKVFDLMTDELLYRFEGLGFLGGPAISFSGDMLATENFSNGISLWDITTLEEILILKGDWQGTFSEFGGVPHRPYRVFFSPDDSLIAADITDDTSRIWNMATGELVKEIPNVGVFSFSPDGTLLTARVDGTYLALYDMTTWETMRILSHGSEVITSAIFTLDSDVLITNTAKGTITFWDWRSGEKLRTISDYSNYLLLSPDGTMLLPWSGRSEEIHFWGIP